jgi:acyl-CoA thioester hydrolase
MFHFDPHKEYATQTISKSIIRFQDCDPLRHLNNAKYFDYFFNAREDQVSKLYGVSPYDFYQTYKSAWVAYNHQIAYIRSARVAEWVTIISRVIHFETDTVVVEYVMSDNEDLYLKTLLWTTLKYVDVATGAKTTHQDTVMQYLKAILHTDIDPHQISFEQRVKQLSNEYKIKRG